MIKLLSLMPVLAVAVLGVSSAAADGGGSFTCDPAHLPANGAVYRNVTVAGECLVSGIAFTITGNVTVTSTGELDIRDNGHVSIHGNLADNGFVHVATTAPASPASLVIGGNVAVVGGDLSTDEFDPEATSPVTLQVAGNFSAVDAQNIRLVSDKVDGSVIGIAGHSEIVGGSNQITLGGGTFGPVVIRNVNDALPISIEVNAFAGSLTLTNNTDAFNGIDANRISGNLSCDGNTPPPTNQGLPNDVAGHESGQCIGL
jgi:hypothetical protein